MELASHESSSNDTRAAAGRAVTLAGQVLLSVTAAFWTWFALAVGFSEGAPSAPYVGGFVGAFALLITLAWWKPWIGGVLALIGGAYAAWRFSARLDTVAMMAGPAFVGGLALLGGGLLKRSAR